MEEKYIYRCISDYDYKAIRKFNYVNTLLDIRYIITTVLAIFLIVFGVIYSGDVTLKVITLIVGIIWLLEFFYLPTIRAKIAYKSSSIIKRAKVEVKYYEDKIILNTVQDENVIGATTLNYNELYKVIDTKATMYLYISKVQAFISSKNNADGDYNKVTEIIKSKIGNKYRKINI